MFDKAEQTLLKEQALLNMGCARVYYQIGNMYGSDRAVRLMHKFHLHLTEKFGFTAKPYLFVFSRGGLYAFNYALYYPEYVDKIYLDALVLNLKSWSVSNVNRILWKKPMKNKSLKTIC